MIRLEITEQQLLNIAEAIDDPATTEKVKRKLLALRMHHEGAKAGLIRFNDALKIRAIDQQHGSRRRASF